MTQSAAETIAISSSGLAVTVSTLGAELQSIQDAAGNDLMWNGDPAVWSGRAPILFPIVGELAGGRCRVDGKDYALSRHGFARRRLFAIEARTPDAVTLRLVEDDESLAVYPFAFVLDITFSVAGSRLDVVAALTNPSDVPLPASFGYHPAFLWPLPGAGDRDGHAIRFDQPETAPIRRLDGHGLVVPEPRENPVVGDLLVLRDELFTDDALVFDQLASRAVTYGGNGGPSIRVEFPEMPDLGIWTKPGAGYVCIEPWQGHADPVGYDGEFAAKPGVVTVAPGETRLFAMGITVEATDPV